MKPSDMLSVHPMLSDRTRLAILAALAGSKIPLEFMELLESLEVTRGNLSSHIRKLEEAGLVQASKEFIDRKPKTTYICTVEGKKSLKHYVNKVSKLLQPIKGKDTA